MSSEPFKVFGMSTPLEEAKTELEAAYSIEARSGGSFKNFWRD
jgi:hypothetical protein